MVRRRVYLPGPIYGLTLSGKAAFQPVGAAQPLKEGQAQGLAGAGAPAALMEDLRHLRLRVLVEQAIHFGDERHKGVTHYAEVSVMRSSASADAGLADGCGLSVNQDLRQLRIIPIKCNPLGSGFSRLRDRIAKWAGNTSNGRLGGS